MTSAVNPPLHTVHLYGHLAEHVGRELQLAGRTPLHLIRLIEVNYPGFAQKLKEGWYRLRVKRPGGYQRDLELDQTGGGFTGDLHIIPALDGAQARKKGLMGVVLGAALVGAAFFFAPAAGMAAGLPGVAGAFGATYGSIAQLGFGLALNGVATLLTPTPRTDYKDKDDRRSSIFNGAVNVASQGGPVPLVLGRMMTGSITVSASVDTEVAGESSGKTLPLTEIHIKRRARVATLDVDDLGDTDEGTITRMNGQVITGPFDTVAIGHGMEVAIDSSKREDFITVTHTGTFPAPGRGVSVTVPYLLVEEGVSYNGSLLIKLGTVGEDPYTKTLASTGADGSFTDTEVTG